MRRTPDVALLIEMSNTYARGLLHGIRQYLREHGPWSIHYGEQRRGEPPPTWLRRWRGQGIIARVETPRIASMLRQVAVPTVDVSAARLLPELPCVETDDQAIAGLAAEHLVERGFKRFAFCPVPGFNWSKWREGAFASEVVGRGFQFFHYEPADGGRKPRDPWDIDEPAVSRWLRRLPKPIGVFAAWDGCGLRLLDMCRRMKIAVPDEVAVLGVDDDELLCDMAEPPLSSVTTDPFHTGYRAAGLLDKMMSGRKVAPDIHRIKPLGITARKSTDVMATQDPGVSQAVRFIRRHACEGINVEDVLDAVPMSRGALDTRFKALLGRTPHDEIVRVRLQRARELLEATHLGLDDIARRSGFRHVEYLSSVFKKKTGVSPSEHRNRHAKRP